MNTQLNFPWVFLLLLFLTNILNAQTTYTQSPTPLSTQYPGGHVGLKGGRTPEIGLGVFMFNRYNVSGDLISSSGQNLGNTYQRVDAIITGAGWNTNVKILGMNLGGLIAVPLNVITSNKPGQGETNNGMGLGDIVVSPFSLYGTAKKWDYQMGLAFWSSTAHFKPGATSSHGPGFNELLYSAGGMYYPDGNRKSINISAVARYEQPFKQSYTGTKPGNAITLDWGIGSPLLPLDHAHKNILMLGICGYANTQVTKETGTYAALDTDLYRKFAIGGEVDYYIPGPKLKFMFRPQWEFGARNTTQGATYWFQVAHAIGKS